MPFVQEFEHFKLVTLPAYPQVNTLIITDVHARDLVAGFQQNGVNDVRDFAWESQLRFYWDRAADSIAIRQCNGAPRFPPLGCHTCTAICKLQSLSLCLLYSASTLNKCMSSACQPGVYLGSDRFLYIRL